MYIHAKFFHIEIKKLNDLYYLKKMSSSVTYSNACNLQNSLRLN